MAGFQVIIEDLVAFGYSSIPIVAVKGPLKPQIPDLTGQSPAYIDNARTDKAVHRIVGGCRPRLNRQDFAECTESNKLELALFG